MHLKELVINLFTSYENIAFLLSICINIVISILGFVPSIFLTAANLTVFGFWEGMAISFVGEALGCVVSFVFYRKGFRRLENVKGFSYPKVQQLLKAESKESFLLILALRILPFVPSGLVTFFASISKTTIFIFIVASTIGKLPAILIEGYSIYQIINWTWEGKIILFVVSLVILSITWWKINKRSVSHKKNL